MIANLIFNKLRDIEYGSEGSYEQEQYWEHINSIDINKLFIESDDFVVDINKQYNDVLSNTLLLKTAKALFNTINIYKLLICINIELIKRYKHENKQDGLKKYIMELPDSEIDGIIADKNLCGIYGYDNSKQISDIYNISPETKTFDIIRNQLILAIQFTYIAVDGHDEFVKTRTRIFAKLDLISVIVFLICILCFIVFFVGWLVFVVIMIFIYYKAGKHKLAGSPLKRFLLILMDSIYGPVALFGYVASRYSRKK
jgi:hypothetical protein